MKDDQGKPIDQEYIDEHNAMLAKLKQPNIYIAAEVGHKKLSEWLQNEEFRKGINTPDKFGNTPLHYAVEKRNVENINALLEAGADPTIKDAQGKLPNLNVQDEKGNTPLHYAVEKRNVENINALLEAGADPTIKDAQGKLPNLNVQDEKGNTPLHAAAEMGKDDLVTKLLENPNVAKNLTNNNGHTPLEVAQKENVNKLLLNNPAIASQVLRTASKEQRPETHQKFDKFMEFVNANPNISNSVKEKLTQEVMGKKETPIKNRLASIGKGIAKKILGRKTENDLVKELRGKLTSHLDGKDVSEDIAAVDQNLLTSQVKRKMMGKGKGRG